MSVYINTIKTALPECRYSQESAGKRMHQWTRDGKAKRYISKIYQDSGIENRHSVIPDLDSDNPSSFFVMADDGYPIEPSTALRNEIYVRDSKRMYIEVAHRLVESCPEIAKEEITHVITVSCTGFYNPGPDLQIIQGLGLRYSTQRYNLGFMGCYGAFPAMKMAKQFCNADSNAVVLIVCLEYCSLHLQLNGNLDSIVANSVFADGAAGVIISSKKPLASTAHFLLDSLSSAVLSEGAEDMAWTIGDRGFDIVLSKYVPKIIGANISDLIGQVLANNTMNLDDIDYWAVHPGGKTILDKVQKGLELEDNTLSDSRAALRDFGNMSSASVLFVLKNMLNKRADSNICALAFGPGLSIESALLSFKAGE